MLDKMPGFASIRRALAQSFLSTRGRSQSPITRIRDSPNRLIHTMMHDFVVTPALDHLASPENVSNLAVDFEDLTIEAGDLEPMEEDSDSTMSDFANDDTDSSIELSIFSDNEDDKWSSEITSIIDRNTNDDPAPASRADEDSLSDIDIDEDLEPLDTEDLNDVIEWGAQQENQEEASGAFIDGVYHANTNEPLEALQEPLREWSQDQILTSRTNRINNSNRAAHNFLFRDIQERQRERFNDDTTHATRNQENIPPPRQNINTTNNRAPLRQRLGTTNRARQLEMIGILNEEDLAPAQAPVRDLDFLIRQTRRAEREERIRHQYTPSRHLRNLR